jgi:transposase
MAPPSLFTVDTGQRIADAVRAGASIRAAADMARVGYTTVCGWLAQGEERHPTRRPTPELVTFAAEVRAAAAEHEQSLLRAVQVPEIRSWQAAAWLLERRFPERWGPSRGRPIA